MRPKRTFFIGFMLENEFSPPFPARGGHQADFSSRTVRFRAVRGLPGVAEKYQR